MRGTKAIKVRIDNRLLEWLRENYFKVNTAINIAVERWVYYEQHNKVAHYIITDVSTRNSRLKYDHGATHTSVRLNEQLYEYIDMQGYVMARVIHNALRTLREDYTNGSLVGNILEELISGNNGKRNGTLNCTHRQTAEPVDIDKDKCCLNCMYGIRCVNGGIYCTKGTGGSRQVELRVNAKCWRSNGRIRG